MTIPSIIQKYQERVTVIKLKETYSLLQQAHKLAVIEHGQPAFWDWDKGPGKNSHIAMANILKPYLKILADCTEKSVDYILANCGKDSFFVDSSASLKLQNGVVVAFRKESSNCTGVEASATKHNGCGMLAVNIDSHNLTKLDGQNVFYFSFTNDGIIPFGVKNGYKATSFEKACHPAIGDNGMNFLTGSMYACAAWVLVNENMDYLHCRENLSWDGKHSCKE